MAYSTGNLTTALAVAVASGAVDRGSKYFVLHELKMVPGDLLTVVPGMLSFVMSWNRGINFGLFASHSVISKFLLSGLAVAVSVALLIWAVRHVSDRIFATGIGLVIGGALGNAYDRIVYGAVADFLNVTCCGIRNPFAFNIADVAIFLGVALLLWRTSHHDRRASRHGKGA